ncbi:MAG: VWA domain-containing protein [Pseudomonadota bacterium]
MTTKIHLRSGIVCAVTLAVAYGCAQPAERTQQPTQPESESIDEVIVQGTRAPRSTRQRAADRREAKRAREDAELGSIIVTGSRVASNGVIGSPYADYVGIPVPYPQQTNRENYAEIDANPVHRAIETPISTLSIDVDTGAYANVRRFLRNGQLPPQDAVRVEELINYFSYDYAAPRERNTPFSVTHEMAPSPWNASNYLLHVGIQGYVPPARDIPNANLVFLVDVSGSMNSPDKLGLLKTSLKMLTKELDADDRVSIVVYAGAAGVVLEPTPGDQRATIVSALERLRAGGSTNGAAGIELAYMMAEQAFIKDGINRVLIATDGDFNVGTVSQQMLEDLIENKRNSGIALTTLGFGTGNYNDHLMEQLADLGNGNYAYIDTLNEARKVLVDELQATMLTIAKDVKIQIEFNPAVVAEYRLIGYENRLLNREDFNNDKVDAGEIGAGHTVTAVYEVSLVGSDGQLTEPLRYQNAERAASNRGELAFLRLRYKQPQADSSQLIETPINRSSALDSYASASENFRFAAAVAAFAQNLRGGTYTSDFDYAAIGKLARSARGDDPHGYRSEFVSLVGLAESLSQSAPVAQAQRGD